MAPVPNPRIVDAFTNKSQKIKSSNDIDQDKSVALKAKIRVIKGVDLYDLVQVVEMCLILNMAMAKKSCVPEFIKYTGIQCPITLFKSYYNKMIEIVYDEKLLMHFFQDSSSGATLNLYIRLDNTKIRR